jgi:hypothetical protein
MARASLVRGVAGSRKGGWDWVSKTRCARWYSYYCCPPPPSCSTFTRSRSCPVRCCVTHLPLQAILSPTAESPSCRTPCARDRAFFFQSTLLGLGSSSTRLSKRIVCCSCISQNQILKMLRLREYLSHGCLPLEKTESQVCLCKFIYPTCANRSTR